MFIKDLWAEGIRDLRMWRTITWSTTRAMHKRVRKRNIKEKEREKMMTDWGPVVVAVAMFILLSPGLLFQLPARTRVIEFGNMYTSGISILVHAILYFCIYTILIVAIGVHIRSG